MRKRRTAEHREAICKALASHEKGRGVILPKSRVDELVRATYEMFLDGLLQTEICEALGASKSRVERWLSMGETRWPNAQIAERRGTHSRSELERFMLHVSPEPNTGCWLWTGGHKPTGYCASIGTHGGGRTQAHRRAYILFNGPIPDGLVVDHTCAQRCCVNPAHLEAVPHGENLRRAWDRRRQV